MHTSSECFAIANWQVCMYNRAHQWFFYFKSNWTGVDESKWIHSWETQSWQVCMQNACRLHATCQNKVAQNCIWLILPSVSEPFAHFCMFFHLLHFTTPHSLCHKLLILLSSPKTIVPPNRQVQKPSLSCKKPACWFIKILINRDSKMMQDFFLKRRK